MSLLTITDVNDATGDTKAIYEEIQSAFGMIPNGIKQWSVNPKAMRIVWNTIKQRLSLDKESQKLHTIIRYLVSDESNCTYCKGFNGSILISMYGMSEDDLVVIKQDNSKAPLEEKNKALLLFAMKSMNDADSVNAQDIATMKALGISEFEMFDIVHAASSMLVANTLFKTFKVEQDYQI